MPYFIYAVRPFAQLQQLGACQDFPAASRQAKVLRAAQPAGQPGRIRIIFADDEITAEDLLLQPREAPPDGDD